MSKKRTLNIALAVMTYNEAGNIPKLLSDTKKAVKDIKGVSFTMFVIDDSSPDGTGKIVVRESKKVRTSNFSVKLLTKSKKEGLGGAYIWGCEQIMRDKSIDYICEMDADLSHNPKYLKDFVAQAQNGAELVIGSRYRKGGAIPDWTLKRKIMSIVGNLYVRFWLGSKFTDWSGGFNMYKVDLLQRLNLETLPKSYTFILTLKNRAQILTSAIAEVPIVFMDRTVGESKIPSSYMKEVLLTCPRLAMYNLRKKITRDNLRAKLPYIAIFAALAIIIATCLIHFDTLFFSGNLNKSWRYYLLSDGDSLVIPLLFKSVFVQHEVFGWLSSSQLFIFPEGILYGIAYVLTLLFTQHFVASLYLCGVFILLSIFALLYFIFKQVTSGDKIKSYLYALLVLSFIAGTMLLEPYYNGGTSLSSFIMMSSYYPGSVLCILAVILATLVIIRKSPNTLKEFIHNKKLIILSVAIILIEAAAIVCDALCLLYIVVPMLLTIAFSFLVNAIKKTPAVTLLAVQILSVGLYFIIRHFITYRFLTNDFQATNVAAVSSALNFYVNGVWPEINRHVFSQIEWSLFALFYVASIVVFCIALYKISRNRNSENSKYKGVLWISFYSWVTILAIVFSNLAGRYATRYFLPLIILPPLTGTVYLAALNKRFMSRILVVVIIVVTVGFLGADVYSVAKYSNGSFTALGANDDSIVCSLEFTNKYGGNTASDSWFYVRALDLYSNDQRALPFTSTGAPDYWINNKYSYKDRGYNIFAVATTLQENDSSGDKSMFEGMKGYEDMKVCDDGAEKLYYYKTGTPGYNRLNAQIKAKTFEKFGWN